MSEMIRRHRPAPGCAVPTSAETSECHGNPEFGASSEGGARRVPDVRVSLCQHHLFRAVPQPRRQGHIPVWHSAARVQKTKTSLAGFPREGPVSFPPSSKPEDGIICMCICGIAHSNTVNEHEGPEEQSRQTESDVWLSRLRRRR